MLWNQSLPDNYAWHLKALVVLLALLFIEWIAIGCNLKHCGFYLDDWTMLEDLHFGPHSFLPALTHYFFVDPRVIIRPLEVLYFALLYSFFGSEPFGYHIVNAVFDVIGAWFIFLAVAECSRSKIVPFTVALMILLYPIHDSSHYWILCSSVTFSFACYAISLWSTIKIALNKERPLYGFLAVAFYMLSIFNYESFLPLFLLNIIWYFVLRKRQQKFSATIKQSSIIAISYVLTIVMLIIYQRLIVPMIGKGLLHGIEFSPALMWHIVSQGTLISSPFYSFPVFINQIQQFLGQHYQNFHIVSLIILCAILISTIWVLRKYDLIHKRNQTWFGLELMLLGVFTVIISFAIFGLNHEYEPSLTTIWNRINYGAAFGFSCIFGGIVALVERIIERFNQVAKTIVETSTVAVICVLVVFFTITNWAFARPWLMSSAVQQMYMNSVKTHKAQILNGDTVMLAHCPRYLFWSPLFDGMWDFQPMLHLILNNQKISGGVISDRLHISDNKIVDISLGTVCESYPLNQMLVITDTSSPWVRVNSGKEFLDAVGSKGGFGIGVGPDVIKRWQQELKIDDRQGQ